MKSNRVAGIECGMLLIVERVKPPLVFTTTSHQRSTGSTPSENARRGRPSVTARKVGASPPIGYNRFVDGHDRLGRLAREIVFMELSLGFFLVTEVTLKCVTPWTRICPPIRLPLYLKFSLTLYKRSASPASPQPCLLGKNWHQGD